MNNNIVTDISDNNIEMDILQMENSNHENPTQNDVYNSVIDEIPNPAHSYKKGYVSHHSPIRERAPWIAVVGGLGLCEM